MHTHTRAAYTRVHTVAMWKGHCSTYSCSRKLPVLRDLWRGLPATLPCRIDDEGPTHRRRLRLRTPSSSQFHREAFSVCRECSSSHAARLRSFSPLPPPLLSFYLSVSLAFCLPPRERSLARPPADASHTARCARLSMRRAAHASRLRTPVPTDAARGALTSPSATRKSGRNTRLDEAPRPAR